MAIVPAVSASDPAHQARIESQVQNQKVGGILYLKSGPVRMARFTNKLQSTANLPVMVAIDGEWGLQMRLKDSAIAFPRQMTLGAHPSEELIFRMGKEVARQCRRVGIHVNFAPDIDINTNPANPVIGMRSFGENKENVALKGMAYARGMQQLGVLACAKHFPGHGDTDKDSHFTLPLVKHSKARLEEIELYPFRRLIADSIGSAMVAHLQIPALEKSGRPSSLSDNVVAGLLRKQMGFGGLIFTDALDMKGSAYASPGELEVLALQAGNDILLTADAALASVALEKAVGSGQIKVEDLNAHVRRILMAKWWMGLHTRPAPIQEQGIYKDLVNPGVQALVNQCYRAAITNVRDTRNLLPFKNLDTMDLLSVSVGEPERNPFQQQLSKYAPFTHYSLPASPTPAQLAALAARWPAPKAGRRRILVVGLHGISGKDKQNYGLSPELIIWLQTEAKATPMVVVAFGNPYALRLLASQPTLVLAYENEPPAMSAAAQALFGAGATGGRLPVSITFNIIEGMQQYRPDVRRLGFGEPEEAGMDSRTLARLDTLAQYICTSGITPGCQMVVARRGKVVYQRSFGYLRYPTPADTGVTTNFVADTTLYDVASITKTAGTLQAIMFLQERGLIDITHPIGEYLPELAGTNKADLILADILTHQAGLVPTLLHWERTLIKPQIGFAMGPPRLAELEVRQQKPTPPDSNALLLTPVITQVTEQDSTPPHAAIQLAIIPPSEPAELPSPLLGTRLSSQYYCTDSDSGWFCRQVAQGLYSARSIEDSVWRWTLRSKLLPLPKSGRQEYIYSDVGFYLLKHMAETLLNQPIDEFLAQNFYSPLGLQTLCYRPLRFFDTSAIAPTEKDDHFRHQTVRGTVHDPGAALIGGVGGHAGLFSNALDLATLMQMNLQNGFYGGSQYLFPQTVPYFTRRYFARNRRGLGWDKPVQGGGGPTAKAASPLTFGHSGFTGTCTWADPKEELVFIFLSNRVSPDADNKRLITENIRPRLQDIVYKAITDTNAVAHK